MYRRALSHYQIVDELGEGGMGIVYKAWDTQLRRHVAIKTLSPGRRISAERKKRLIHEARAASALNHPAIVTIHDIVHDDGKDFIVMELVEGETLSRLTREDGLPVDQALDYAVQMASALAVAHSHGIVHRDVKPANVMVTGDGTVKILDFGLAKLDPLVAAGDTAAATETDMHTRVGAVLGTYAYMSPEQARGDPVDARSDVFSLGLVLYRMLSGRSPFQASNAGMTIHQILYEEPPAVESIRADLPGGLGALIGAALEKDPEERLQSAEELRRGLEAIRGGTATPALPLGGRARSKIRRRRVWAVAALLAVLLAGVVSWKLEWLPLPSGDTAASEQRHIAILPLANVSDDPEKQAFSDGLVETLTSKLTQLEELGGSLLVVPASEIRSRGIESVDAARKAFAVNLAVTGSLRRDAYQVRLTLNLVDAATLRQVASSVLDLDAGSFADLEDSASIRLARMLEVEVEPRLAERLRTGGTSQATAYDLYLQALGNLQRFDRRQSRQLAIELFQRALDADPGYALAAAGLAAAFWREYEATKEAIWVERARSAAESALELDPGLAQVHVTLGLLAQGTGKYEEAVADFERALAIDPRNANAHRELAKALEALKRPAEAEAALQRAIDLRRGDWLNHNRLGKFYFRNGRYDEAVGEFRQVTELAPNNTRGYNNLGGMLFYLGRHDEAREYFERSLRVEPNYAAASNLGTISFSQGRYREAAEAFETALDIDPSEFQVVINLGSAYSSAGDKEKGRAAYRRAARMVEKRLQVNPNDADVVISLANLFALTGRHEDVPALIERALALAPEDVEVMIVAAEAWEHIGERDTALEWVHRALAGGYPLSGVESNPSFRQLVADLRFSRTGGAQRGGGGR